MLRWAPIAFPTAAPALLSHVALCHVAVLAATYALAAALHHFIEAPTQRAAARDPPTATVALVAAALVAALAVVALASSASPESLDSGPGHRSGAVSDARCRCRGHAAPWSVVAPGEVVPGPFQIVQVRRPRLFLCPL